MTLLLAAAILGLGFGWATGGTIRGLEFAELRFGNLMLGVVVVLGLVPALPLTDLIHDERILVWAIWMPLAVLATVVAVLNRRIMGMDIVATGVMLNLFVVAANAGMPVMITNLPREAAALAALQRSWLHVQATALTRLPMLADVIPIPGPPGLRGMASLGDMLLALGVSVSLVAMMHTNDEVSVRASTASDGSGSDVS